MANEEHLSILKQGVEVWNKWRDENSDIDIDLHGANLNGAHLTQVNLTGADLGEANLTEADLSSASLDAAELVNADLTDAILGRTNFFRADLRYANLTGSSCVEAHFEQADLANANLSQSALHGANFEFADLIRADFRHARLHSMYVTEEGRSTMSANLADANASGADLSRASLLGVSFYCADLSNAILQAAECDQCDFYHANLHSADLRRANLTKANLTEADLTDADLRSADLTMAILIGAVVDHTKISGITVYGVNVWDLRGKFDEQKDLVVTSNDAPVVTVDNIRVAQFIHLILNHEEIRDVINTLTSKSVLLLGRFTLERKVVLDALKNKLREYNLLPIIFDFDRPTDKDFTETIKTLAGLCYFVIADVTNPKSSPLELQATVPDYQIPFVPIIQEGESPFAMMVDLQKKYSWVLDTLSYSSVETLIKALKPAIIDPAIKKHNELRAIKAREPKIRSADDFVNNKWLG